MVSTLDALAAFLDLEEGSSLIGDLKLSSLFEHLASEILAQISPILGHETQKLFLLEALSMLSKRELALGHQLVLDGLVVVTQRDVNVKTERKSTNRESGEHEWKIVMVRCGIPALRHMFEEKGLAVLSTITFPPGDPSGGGPDDSANGRGNGGDGPGDPKAGTTPPTAAGVKRAETAPVIATAPDPGLNAEPSARAAVSPATAEMLVQLETACRLRRFPIETIDPELAQQGPTLVTVPVALQAGEKIAPIIQATSDLARELGVSTVVVENDPSRPYFIRFLLPRADRQFPTIPPVPPAAANEHYLPLWLGAHVDGTPYRSHVSEWPHLLVAGTTGSGKTTFLRSLLIQIAADESSKVIVVDGKGEFDYLDLIPSSAFVSQFPDVLLGPEHVVAVLDWLVNEEIARRRDLLRDYFRANAAAPKASRQAYFLASQAGSPFPIAPMVIFVDEFAELMLSAGASAKAFEDLVQRVVQAGRSALVHLVLATQRPDANVLRGAIKANLPSRVALALPSHHDSMTVLNAPGAEQLLGKGDLFFQSSTVDRIRLQGFMLPL